MYNAPLVRPTCTLSSLCICSPERRRVVTEHHGSADLAGNIVSVHICDPLSLSTSAHSLCITQIGSPHFEPQHPAARRNILILRTEQLIRVQYGCLYSYWLRAGLCRLIGRGNGCKIKRATDSTSEKMILNRRRSDC